MRKPRLVLRSDAQALPLMRRAQASPYDSGLQLKHAASQKTVPSLQLGPPHPFAEVGIKWEEHVHKAKLRLLAPALRRALSASTQDAARRQDQAHREDQLQAPASMLLHGWTMAQWVSVCFSPADAPQLRIYWVLV